MTTEIYWRGHKVGATERPLILKLSPALTTMVTRVFVADDLPIVAIANSEISFDEDFKALYMDKDDSPYA